MSLRTRLSKDYIIFFWNMHRIGCIVFSNSVLLFLIFRYISFHTLFSMNWSRISLTVEYLIIWFTRNLIRQDTSSCVSMYIIFSFSRIFKSENGGSQSSSECFFIIDDFDIFCFSLEYFFDLSCDFFSTENEDSIFLLKLWRMDFFPYL